MSVAVKKEAQDAGTPQTFEEALATSFTKLEQTLKTLPPEKVAEAKKEADKLLKGDLSWGDLSRYTPDKLLKIA